MLTASGQYRYKYNLLPKLGLLLAFQNAEKRKFSASSRISTSSSIANFLQAKLDDAEAELIHDLFFRTPDWGHLIGVERLVRVARRNKCQALSQSVVHTFLMNGNGG